MSHLEKQTKTVCESPTPNAPKSNLLPYVSMNFSKIFKIRVLLPNPLNLWLMSNPLEYSKKFMRDSFKIPPKICWCFEQVFRWSVLLDVLRENWSEYEKWSRVSLSTQSTHKLPLLSNNEKKRKKKQNPVKKSLFPLLQVDSNEKLGIYDKPKATMRDANLVAEYNWIINHKY